jgi:hypothetical protein
MKKLIAALALTTAACAAPVFAADVGLSLSIGEPGFYGQLDIGSADRPRLINSRPVVVVNRYRNLAPVYLRVPVAEQRNWKRYCDRYNACMRPVYFVRDDWYTRTYAPHYREQHGNGNWHDDHHDDHHDGHDNPRNDRR